MTYLAFTVGLIGGSVLFLTALRKIIEPQQTAAQVWKPAYVRGVPATAAIVVVGTAEAVIAVISFVPIVPRQAAIAAIAVLAVAVTTYGLLALQNFGTCGCGSAMPEVLTKRALFSRNAILFSSLAVSAGFGPSMSSLESNAAVYSLSAILACYVVVGALAVRSRWRVVSPGPKRVASITFAED